MTAPAPLPSSPAAVESRCRRVPLPSSPVAAGSRCRPAPLDLRYDLRHTLVALTMLFESVCSGTIVPAPIGEGANRWNPNGECVRDGWEDVHRQSLNILLS